MEALSKCQDFQAQLLESIIKPLIPLPEKKRARSAPSKIKVLYHLFQLHKNVANGKWTEIYQGRKKIAQKAKVSLRHFKEFISDPDFKLFGSRKHRGGTTSVYTLHNWVIQFFEFFEKKGMMKDFRTDFNGWKERFVKRLHNWLLPLLRKGHSLTEILMNKLSTKKTLKGTGSNSLKGAKIKPSGSSHEAFGIKTKDENAELGTQESNLVAGILSNRLHLSGSDIHQFLFKNPLHLVKKAALTLCYRIEILKWEARSNVRALQDIINEIKKEKRAA